MAEQEDALGSNPGSSKEYEFDSHQGDHHDERRTSMKLRLTDYNDSTYVDTDGSCELCMYTGLLDHPEFQFTDSDGGVHDISGWESDWGHLNIKYNVNMPLFTYWLHDAELDELAKEARLHGLGANETDPWDTALDAILWSASGQSSEEALSWALVDETA